MKRFTPYALLILGLCLIMTGVMVMAQDEDDAPEPPEYAGTRECRDCHRSITTLHGQTAHALTMVEVEEDADPEETPIVADFSVGDEERSITFPGESAARPFTPADVAFTLGAGRHLQAFIYQDDESETYYVLPAEWNVTEQAWHPLELAENWPDEAYAFGPNCAGCHTVGLNVNDNYEWEEEGVMCESCHGPGLDHVEFADDAGGSIDEEELADIQGAINLGFDAQTCGQCHSRGLAEDGIHPYPVGYYPGLVELSDVFTLADTGDDAHWFAIQHAKLPNMQYNEWLLSGHPNALSTAQESEGFEAACMSCHSVAQNLIDLRLNSDDIDPETLDPLAIMESLPSGITCASCHNSHMAADDESTVAPSHLLREESYALCVSCHRDDDVTEGVHHPVQQVFEGQPIVENINVQPSPHFSAEDGPKCATCHMPTVPTINGDRSSHTFNIIEPGAAVNIEALQDSCSGCHEQSPAALQQLIDDLQNGTRQRITQARESAGDAATGGAVEWVYTALDVVDNEGSYGIHNYAYTSALLESVEQELGLSSASLTDADVSAEIDTRLPNIPPADALVESRSTDIATATGLAAPTIVLLALFGFILIFAAFSFFRSN